MEEKLFDKFIEKEMSKEKDLMLPPSIDLKLNKAYELIREEESNLKSLDKYKDSKGKRKRIIAAASLVFVLLTAVIATPALADNIPPLKELSKYLKNIYSYNDNYISNASQLNMVKKYDGIEINLQGVIYDDSSLKFIYTVTSDKKLQWGFQMRNNSLKINGREILEQVYSQRISTDQTRISKDDEKLEKYAVITSYDISDLKLDDKVDIDWAINEVHTQNYKFAEGDWDFKFKASKELLKANSKIVDVNYKTEVDGYKFGIDKIIITPTETKIISEDDSKFNEACIAASEAYRKNPKDKNTVDKFYKLDAISSQLDIMNMNITDENGNEISATNGNYKDGKYITSYTPFKGIPKKIVITPRGKSQYSFIYSTSSSDDDTLEKLEEISGRNNIISEERYIPLSSIKTPFTFNQGVNMTVTINSIEHKDNSLKINATFNGDFVASRVSNPFDILPKGLKYPTNGEEKVNFYNIVDGIDNHSTWNYAEKANNKNNTFDYEYKINDNQDYNIVIQKYEFMKDKQIVIDVK